MNAYELQALRHIFAMTIDECATWIAQTGDSESWRQWENGKYAIPDRVVEQLLAMRQQRKKHLHAIIEKINNRIGNNTMRFFPDLTAFQQVYPDGNFIDWKIYQSVAGCCQLTDLVYDGVFEVLQWLLFLSAVPPVQLLTGWCVTAKAPPDISAISALTAVKHGNCSSLTPLLNPVRTRKSLIWP